MNTDVILKAENLDFSYDEGRSYALKGLSLELKRGRKIIFMGANGSGKSTFFLCCAGVCKPQRGRLYFNGKEIAYDKKSLDGGLLETGQDADFTKSIFNEDLVVESEAVDFINSIPADKIRDVINDLFMPILRIDNSGDNDDEAQFEVERKSNGFILKFKLDFDRNEASGEHLVSIYFKMPRVWNSIFEVTLVDPTKEPHIKLKYKNGMDVTMYSYLNKESTANVGACIQRAGLYDIAIKDEWIYPKSGVIFHIKKA